MHSGLPLRATTSPAADGFDDIQHVQVSGLLKSRINALRVVRVGAWYRAVCVGGDCGISATSIGPGSVWRRFSIGITSKYINTYIHTYINT
jgi:hypothetical protein